MDMINTVLKKEGLSYDFSFDDFFGQWCPYTWTVSELQDIFLTELGIDGKLEIEDLQKVKRWAGLFMEEQVKKYKSTFVVLLR